MWAEDRIHLTTEGHRRVALAALTALGHRTDLADWTTPLRRPTAARVPRSFAATRVGPLSGPSVQRRLQGRSSANREREATTSRLPDPEGEPDHQALPEG